jgi:hypothetical protein
MLMEADLPHDVEALRALVLEQARELDVLKVFQAEVERLKAIIEALQRHRFGRHSEQLDPGQFELALEEVEMALAQAQHARARRAGHRRVARARSTAARCQPISSGSSRSSRRASITASRASFFCRLPGRTDEGIAQGSGRR